MPIYEYQCDNCQHTMEALQKVSDDPLKECPECKTCSLKKKLSAVGFRLKGGGWYETDFKTGDKKNLAGGDKADSADKGDSAGKGKDDSAASKSSGDAGSVGASSSKTATNATA